MMFADFGEGRAAPGVAAPNNSMRRQANGLPAYGTGSKFLPALPGQYAAVEVGNLGDDVSMPTQPMPTHVVMPTRSTTLARSVIALTTLTTGANTKGQTTTQLPSYQTFPSPPPQAPSSYPVGPSFPGMDDVGAAAAGAAGRVGAIVNAQPAGGGMSRGTMIGIGLLAAAAAATGLVIVWKHR